MRDTNERLQDIQEAISRIEKYTSQGRKRFDEDELVQTWVERHLEKLGNQFVQFRKISKTSIPKYLGRRLTVCGIYSSISILAWITISSGRW